MDSVPIPAIQASYQNNWYFPRAITARSMDNAKDCAANGDLVRLYQFELTVDVLGSFHLVEKGL